MKHGRQASEPGSTTSRAVTGLACAATFATVLATVPSTRTWAAAATVASLMILPAALATSVFSWVAWRMSPLPSTAWLTAATTMVGVQWPLLVLDADDDYDEIGTVSSTVVVGFAVLLVVWLAVRYRLRFAPVAVGVSLGLLLLLVPIGWANAPWDDRVLPEGAASTGVGVAVLLLIGALVAAALLRASTLPVGVGRLASAALLWTWCAALGVTDLAGDPGWAVATIAAGLAATALLLSVGVDLLLLVMSDEVATVRSLERELQSLRDQTRADVEHLHEVKGTIAGIASASAMITNEHRLAPQERARLTQMLTSETARLSRLFDDRPAGSPAPVADLDDIIRPLVVAHRVQGQDVVWHAPPEQIILPADAVAEAVNILLHNAAEHAPGSPVWVYTRRGDDGVELVVVDLGPGIPDGHQDDAFRWGWRGPDSRGRGVGLAIAADLVSGLGGTLRSDTRQRRGACFVIALPGTVGSGAPYDRSRGDGALDPC
jgi:signal transduction histidine kinase